MNLKFWKKHGKNKRNCQTRTRFAPSPTGYLHIGSLRTALYNYLCAKQNDGKFILRLEDTDIERYVEGAAEAICSGLKWAGLEYDEGPDVGGLYSPYIQSERLEIYKKYAYELLGKGYAYYCFCDKKTLEKMRQEQTAAKKAPKYDRRCLNLPKEKIEENLKNKIPHVIRMKVPGNSILKFNDIVRGEIEFNSNEIDDQVILKSDDYPTYHLAVVIDDHLMDINYVIRSEEWLSSTPKHILLYKYFGWQTPEWVHLPLVLNPDKSKMSKRKDDVVLENYIKKGYLPHAIINFLVFLGWNPGKGIYFTESVPKVEKEIYFDGIISDEEESLKKLLENIMQDFTLNKIHKAGAIFNINKLNWFNQYYIRQLSDNLLFEKCKPYLPKNIDFTDEQIIKMLNLEKERAKTLAEIGESVKFFFEAPKYDKKLLIWKETSLLETKKSLEKLCDILEKLAEEEFTKEKLARFIMPEAEKSGDRGIMLWPLRAALSGQAASPGPFEIAEILGKNKTLNRLQYAIKLIET
jgi:glutamyl-tRNA synthetase